ncbi:MAG: hypothetical protein PHY12_06740, partial [Eubacteriales bacterium]|nr:hypothetical protein [Eubacteriales bacterium]
MPEPTSVPQTAAIAEGEEIFRRGSVRLVQQDADALVLQIGVLPARTVVLPAHGDPTCTCGAVGEKACAHIAAATMAAEEDGSLRTLRQAREVALGREMLGALSRAMPGGETVRLTAAVKVFPDGRIGFGLSLGQERPYAVKSVVDLLSCYAYGQPLALSPKFTYQPQLMRFSKDDEAMLA